MNKNLYYKKTNIFYKLIKLIILLVMIYFNFFIKNKNKTMTVICVIAKQENRYIKEFVNYYRKLKITKIFLYDNNDLNGEYFEDILSKYIKFNFIEIVNYRGKYKPQMQAYEDCYIKNNKNYNWIAFYDADEYLYINNFSNINKFLSLSQFKNCSSILINWKNYGDNDKIYYEPKPLQKRFTKPFYFNNYTKKNKYFYAAGKTIARAGLNLSWAHLPHYLNNKPICRPNGQILRDYFSKPQYSKAYIKHYATKSTEEFIERTIRGAVLTKDTSRKFIIDRIKNYKFN
jgi:hypothetical protein